MTSPNNSSERKVATPTRIVVIIAVVALLLGFGWGRQSAELDGSTTTQASTTTAPIRTTTTVSPVQTATSNLRRALNNADAAALLDLATSYEAMGRAFDNADQAAWLAIWLSDDMIEVVRGTLDELDLATYTLSVRMLKQLRDQLDPTDWTAINHYLSLVPSSPSDFDRFLEAIGLEPNLTEIYALLDALN